MRNSMNFGLMAGVALLVAAMVGVTVAEESKDTLQSSWNDYPAKWVKSSGLPGGTAEWGPRAEEEATPSEDQQMEPSEPRGRIHLPPPWLIQRRYQQQQSKPSGGFASGGGKTGGSAYYGGKHGGFGWGKTQGNQGGFSWGKTRPRQAQQGFYPRGDAQTPQPAGDQANSQLDELHRYIQQLEEKNRALQELLDRINAYNANNDTDPDTTNNETPLE